MIADFVAIYGRGRELFKPPAYVKYTLILIITINWTLLDYTLSNLCTYITIYENNGDVQPENEFVGFSDTEIIQISLGH
jgi:hypothetical protein